MVTLRFYARLNDFLPPGRRQVAFSVPLERRTSVKDLIEALGVPHPEVGLILINGEPADFSRLVEPEDRISVYPALSSLEALPALRGPVIAARFVLDVHLGKLATYLRMLGFDAMYCTDATDEALAEVSAEQNRILLTRDLGLLKRSIVEYGYFVRESDPKRQLREVTRRFDLGAAIQPFQRCIACNGLLEPVEKEAALDRLEPKTRRYYDEFKVCAGCGKIYWRGPHYERMREFIDELRM